MTTDAGTVISNEIEFFVVCGEETYQIHMNEIPLEI